MILVVFLFTIYYHLESLVDIWQRIYGWFEAEEGAGTLILKFIMSHILCRIIPS